ncbi:DUF2817 domain-containing protein [Nonlabens sp.]|uniref:M14 family zinc carboxypeptidase n=1 Tax=Nonlabens sp. TaxID=1888209 RepID=UPI003266446C
MLSRYYSCLQFEDALKTILDALGQKSLLDIEIGKSVNGRSVYGIKLGAGKTKVLVWSQMHGNESSTTRALFKLLKSDDFPQLLENISLYIIPILNPDGSEKWTRVNANNVDLNRDAIDLTQPESQILRSVFDDFAPDYCLNLHGQRTIFGSLDGEQPAQISFLAPAGDLEKTISQARLRSMQIINAIQGQLKNKVDGIIGRYSDDFNINCVGDYMTSKQVPTVLFEAGHSGDDYSRDQVTDLMYESLKIAFKTIQDSAVINESNVVDVYNSIPHMSKAYVDVLVKNYRSVSGLQTLSVQYHEQVKDGVLYFVPILIGINREDVLNGHRVIDLNDFSDFKDDLIIEGNLEIRSKSLDIGIFY